MTRRRLPETRSLEAFATTARLGSFQAAGAQLNITPSAVSQRIGNLEKLLGSRLFERKSNAIALSPAGFDLLDDAETALSVLTKAVERYDNSVVRQQVVLATPPVDAMHWLLPRLAGFYDQFPDIDLQVRSSTAVVDLARSDIDAAVRSLPDTHHDATLTKHLIYEERLILVCSPNSINPHDSAGSLFDYKRLRSLASPDAWSRWDQAMLGGEAPRASHIDLTNDTETLEAASRGLGVAIVHERVAQRWIDSGRLVRMSSDTLPAARGCYLVYKTHHSEKSSIKALRAWLIGQHTAAAVEE